MLAYYIIENYTILHPTKRSPKALIVTLTPKYILATLPLATLAALLKGRIRKPSAKVLEA